MHTSIFSNIELFGIQSDALRYTWTIFNGFLLLSSLTGDSLILIGSIKYKAIKLHPMIRAIMQHMAALDLMLSTFLIIPNLVSLIANKWVLGDALCIISAYFAHFGYPASIYLILAMTTTKLIIVKFPFRAASWPAKRAHLIAAVIWLYSLNLPVLFIAIGKYDVSFDYRRYGCDYGFTNTLWSVLLPIFSLTIGIIPNILVITTTLMLLLEARKVTKRAGRGESMRMQGVLTVVLTATVFTVSFLPFSIYHMGASFVVENPPGKFHAQFYKIAGTIMSLTIMSNFYIYSLTMNSFKQFLVDKIGHIFSRSSPNQGI